MRALLKLSDAENVAFLYALNKKKRLSNESLHPLNLK